MPHFKHWSVLLVVERELTVVVDDSSGMTSDEAEARAIEKVKQYTTQHFQAKSAMARPVTKAGMEIEFMKDGNCSYCHRKCWEDKMCNGQKGK